MTTANDRKCLDMIWANEAGVSIYVYEAEHGRREIEIHGVVNDYETVLARATIEKHNLRRVMVAFTPPLTDFVKKYNISDKDMVELAQVKPPIQSAATPTTEAQRCAECGHTGWIDPETSRCAFQPDPQSFTECGCKCVFPAGLQPETAAAKTSTLWHGPNDEMPLYGEIVAVHDGTFSIGRARELEGRTVEAWCTTKELIAAARAFISQPTVTPDTAEKQARESWRQGMKDAAKEVCDGCDNEQRYGPARQIEGSTRWWHGDDNIPCEAGGVWHVLSTRESNG